MLSRNKVQPIEECLTKPVLHVVFNSAAAETLRRAILSKSLSDHVVCLLDDYSAGPIGEANSAARAAWMESELFLGGWHTAVAAVPEFLQATRAVDVMPVAWFSRRDAQSYSGVLWWLSKMGAAPCQIIDTTDLSSDSGRLTISPSALGAVEMANLLGTQIDAHPDLREQYAAVWNRLKSENAAFRVVDQVGGIYSQPITYFDPALIAAGSRRWRPIATLIGDVLSGFLNQSLNQASDAVLHSRIRILADLAIFDWRGDLSVLRACDVRLPPPHSMSEL